MQQGRVNFGGGAFVCSFDATISPCIAPLSLLPFVPPSLPPPQPSDSPEPEQEEVDLADHVLDQVHRLQRGALGARHVRVQRLELDG